MRIKLHNIGIVKDSEMYIEGLTIITGKNNSGKTTVGKALYSLLDATSNINAKERRDRCEYISKKLENILDNMDFIRLWIRSIGKMNNDNVPNPFDDYPSIDAFLTSKYRHDILFMEIEQFAHRLYDELSSIDIQTISQRLADTFNFVSATFDDEKKRANDFLAKELYDAIEMLGEMFTKLSQDSQLIAYARESINQTLKIEFSDQIQPAKFEVESSKIELYDSNTCCYDVTIINNRVYNDGTPVYFTSPYKKVFFIDNPFIFDDPFVTRRYIANQIDEELDSFLRPNNIVSHNNNLKYVLRRKPSPSVLEQTLLTESLQKIKAEIDTIIPGTFEFSSSGDYYVQNGTKLKVPNLATGSKMFSIIKILLEKGELDKSTMLILDEPEAHLHPSWQNRFAEMIVLLVKEMGVNILLTTHSSNFVLAIDAYMRKYEIQDCTNFYRTEFLECGMVEYNCVNENMDVIYKDFLQSLSDMKMLRNRIIKNEGDNA